MAAPIRLSALGRDAQVGNLYNYFTDAILPSGIEVPEASKLMISREATTFSFFFQQDYQFKPKILGINSHLLQSINKGLPNSHQPWFNSYLYAVPKDGDADEAHVTVVCQLRRRTEALDWQFLRSKMYECHRRNGDRATHLINEVVYGAEMICSMKKRLNLQRETKETIERSIYLAANDYLNQLIVGESASTDLLVRLEDVTCTVLSSLEAGEQFEMSFPEFSQYLQKLCDKDVNLHIWKPIELLLSAIPTQLECYIWFDEKNDFEKETQRHQFMWTRIKQAILSVSNNSSTNRFAPFQQAICHFQKLMPFFREKIEECYKMIGTYSPQHAVQEMRPISHFLNDIIVWLARLQNEIEEFSLRTKDTTLIVLDWVRLENRMAKNEKKNIEVLVLTVESRQNHLINYMTNTTGHHISTATLPFLPIISYERKTYEFLRSTLKELAKEDRLTDGGLPGDVSYYIELIPATSSSANDAIKTDVDFEKLPDVSVDGSPTIPRASTPITAMDFEQKQQNQMETTGPPQFTTSLDQLESPASEETTVTNQLSTLSSDSESIEAEGSSTITEFIQTAETQSNHNNPSVKNSARRDEMGNKAKPEKRNLSVKETSEREQNGLESVGSSTLLVSQTGKDEKVGETQKCRPNANELPASFEDCTACSKPSHHDRNLDGQEQSLVEGPNNKYCNNTLKSESVGDNNCGLPTKGGTELCEQRRIADMFKDGRSKLIKTGPPDVYLLNVTEKINGNDIKCFDISRPGGSSFSINHKNHKIIILMGATGSGKSTLINGMINYILGVQWNDPFRFKCVREEENVKKQSQSQTNSVTAYNLYHEDGMAIPYSITIIDTPGYGDTRGMQRDKQITTDIHRFLSQKETQINEIHAACFVAASGDSRLTATQRYIIDSVLSIFGKDMKENIRLLVTFADNADPPVVDACLGANFPVTSESAGLTYSKFNSSVLYCSNAKQEEDEFSVDELFWDMGQENFQKFLDMLEGMPGRDLKSTREVIDSRQQLKQSLIGIEQEMEVCLANIESIEILQREIKVCRSKFDCWKEYFAYNCHSCNDTCESFITKSNTFHNEKRSCTRQHCTCPPSEHKLEKWEWRFDSKQMSAHSLDLKAQYESNLKRPMKVEELLDTCSGKLQVSKAKALSLLDQVAKNVQLLESTALRSNVVSPSDYLSLMRSRVLEEQQPGYFTRLQTLDELQQLLGVGRSQPMQQKQTLKEQEQSLNASAKKGQSNSSRDIPLESSATGTAGKSEFKSDYPGTNGRNETRSGHSRRCMTVKDEDGQNPDGSVDSFTDSSLVDHEEMNKDNESSGILADDHNTYSSDNDADQRDEKKKVEKKPNWLVSKIKSKLGLDLG